MYQGLYLVDFHAHLKGSAEVGNFCKEDQSTPFWRNTVHLFERVANMSEPIHDGLLRYLAMHYRGAISRHIYTQLGQVGLMEVIRLFKNNAIQQMVASMDRNGIDHVVIHALEPYINTREVLEVIEPYRSRFSVFASVGRDEPDPAGYFESHVKSGEISGLKIHPLVGGFACGELYHRTKDSVALAVEQGLPILIHTGHIPADALMGLDGCNEVAAIEPLVAAFPRGKFILAHIGWESWRKVLDLGRRYPQVSVETSWQPAKIIRRAVDALGPERVIFGSDFPLFRQSLALKQVRDALSDREFVMVASTNGRRLLRLHRHSESSVAG